MTRYLYVWCVPWSPRSILAIKSTPAKNGWRYKTIELWHSSLYAFATYLWYLDSNETWMVGWLIQTRSLSYAKLKVNFPGHVLPRKKINTPLYLMLWGVGKSKINSMSVDRKFQRWLLISWRLCCQPIRSQVWKVLLINTGFNMEFPSENPVGMRRNELNLNINICLNEHLSKYMKYTILAFNFSTLRRCDLINIQCR